MSGGFATVQPGNSLSINAVEAYSLEDFAPEAIRSGLAEAQRVANGGGSEEEVAEAKIEVEVYEALQACPPNETTEVNPTGCWSKMIWRIRLESSICRCTAMMLTNPLLSSRFFPLHFMVHDDMR